MARIGGLGKGLSALIPGEEPVHEGESIQLVSPDNIVPNPRQPRAEMAVEELEELANSIREHGILQPLIVTPGENPGEYVLIAGERRLRASRIVNLDLVPVIIRRDEISDVERFELALIENIQRANLSTLETANAYQKLVEEFQLTHDEVAKKVGKNRTTVTNTIRLLKLPQKVQEALQKGLVSEGHARVLLALPTPQAQIAVLAAVLEKGLNVRQTEKLVQKYSGHQDTTPQKPVYYAQVKGIEDDLRQALGTKVTLHYTPKGGSVVIHYFSDEELNSIVEKIKG